MGKEGILRGKEYANIATFMNFMGKFSINKLFLKSLLSSVMCIPLIFH